jgi:hypothetical protein
MFAGAPTCTRLTEAEAAGWGQRITTSCRGRGACEMPARRCTGGCWPAGSGGEPGCCWPAGGEEHEGLLAWAGEEHGRVVCWGGGGSRATAVGPRRRSTPDARADKDGTGRRNTRLELQFSCKDVNVQGAFFKTKIVNASEGYFGTEGVLLLGF